MSFAGECTHTDQERLRGRDWTQRRDRNNHGQVPACWGHGGMHAMGCRTAQLRACNSTGHAGLCRRMQAVRMELCSSILPQQWPTILSPRQSQLHDRKTVPHLNPRWQCVGCGCVVLQGHADGVGCEVGEMDHALHWQLLAIWQQVAQLLQQRKQAGTHTAVERASNKGQ